MSSKQTQSTISHDGLRYRDRQPNAQFPAVTAGSSMSCYWCSAHRGASSLALQKILGKSQRVCSPPCSKNHFARKSAEADQAAT